MTIRLITGTPGSGKTLLAVKLLTDQYFNFSKRHKQFFLKPEYSDLTIITNIDNLKLPHISIDTAFRESKLSFDKFFTESYQRKIIKKYPKIIYVLDECQRWLSRRLKDPETVFYFDRHRHLDHEIFLITQDIKKIHSDIATLIEFEYRLTKRTFSVTGEFRYLMKASGTIFERKAFRPNRHLFNLYKSFESSSNQLKKKNVFLKYLAVPLVLFLVCGWLFYDIIGPDSHASTVPAKNNLSSGALRQSGQSNPFSINSNRSTVKIPITNIIKINDEIYKFQNPITKLFQEPSEIDFTIHRTKNSFYMVVDDAELQHQKELASLYDSLKPKESNLPSIESENLDATLNKPRISAFFNK